MLNKMKNNQMLLLGILRTFFGFIFLWAFFDKTFGLGYATPIENAWINGASPTMYYLSNLTGTFAGIFNNIAGNFFVDWLFMLGLLGIGISLTFGVFNKLGNVSGILFMVLMYLSVLPTIYNPFVDEHFIYILLFVVFYFIDTTNSFGIKKLNKMKVNQRFSFKHETYLKGGK